VKVTPDTRIRKESKSANRSVCAGIAKGKTSELGISNGVVGELEPKLGAHIIEIIKRGLGGLRREKL
jgi:hypothetical protein